MAEQEIKPKAKLARVIKVILSLGLITLLLAALLVMLGLFMLQSKDPDWNPPDPNAPENIRMADEFDQKVMGTRTTLTIDYSPHELTLYEQRVNAWIAAKLEKWLKAALVDTQLLDQIKDPHLRFKDGNIKAMGQLELNSGEQQITMILVPELRGDTIWLTLQGINAGRVPLPLEKTLTQVTTKFGYVENHYKRMITESRVSVENSAQMNDKAVIDAAYGSKAEAWKEAERRANESIRAFPLTIAMEDLGIENYRVLRVAEMVVEPGVVKMVLMTDPEVDLDELKDAEPN